MVGQMIPRWFPHPRQEENYLSCGTHDVCLQSTDPEFEQQVADMLSSGKGWRDHQFKIVEEGCPLRINLVPTAEAEATCKLPGLSCFQPRVDDTGAQNIWLSADRWYESSEAFLSGGSTLDDYRQYLLFHELGHFLGRGHTLACSDDGFEPVMRQQTKGHGPEHGFEVCEQRNVRPLPQEDEVTFYP